MAPRKKKSAAKSKAAERVKGSEVTGMITESALKSILALDKRTKTKQAELAGELGGKVSDAIERFGTNRKALGVIRQLNRLEPEKLADFVDHFQYMMDISGLDDRASSVERLPLEDGPGDGDKGDGKPAGEGDSGNVSRPKFGVAAE